MYGTKLLIVFGVSGVGKTTACAEFAVRHENVEHLSASQLLGLERSSAIVRSEEEALYDQDKLVELVLNARAVTAAKVLLLDAHSVFFVGGRQLIVPARVIASMEPTGLIFVKADPEVIVGRRSGRGDRGAYAPDTMAMEQLQLVALRAVEEYSRIISCPISIVDANQSVDLVSAVESLIQSSDTV